MSKIQDPSYETVGIISSFVLTGKTLQPEHATLLASTAEALQQSNPSAAAFLFAAAAQVACKPPYAHAELTHIARQKELKEYAQNAARILAEGKVDSFALRNTFDALCLAHNAVATGRLPDNIRAQANSELENAIAAASKQFFLRKNTQTPYRQLSSLERDYELKLPDLRGLVQAVRRQMLPTSGKGSR